MANYAILDGASVINIIVLDPADADHFPDAVAIPGDEPVAIGWTCGADGWHAPVVEVPPEQIKAALTTAVQAHIDATARSRGYNDGTACASYAASTNAAWSAEAKAFVAWRDTVWTAALATLAAVEAGTEAPPSVDDLIDGLPAIVWP